MLLHFKIAGFSHIFILLIVFGQVQSQMETIQWSQIEHVQGRGYAITPLDFENFLYLEFHFSIQKSPLGYVLKNTFFVFL